MSAGSGVTHSEFNPSGDTPTELYQIWLLPNQSGGEPLYEEKHLGPAAKDNALTPLFSGTNRPGTTPIRQDAEISFGKLHAGHALTMPEAPDHPYAWVQLIDGEINLLGQTLEKADGLAISDHPGSIQIKAEQASHFMVFRMQ